MIDVEIYSDEILAARRYPSVVKTRKQWTCSRCGLAIEKGGQIEHSYSADMKLTIELCLDCVRILSEISYE